ncbi:MAG TPA: MBL fold metallo-hydrolase [Tepidisphaeraceae bacterium]|nr:MBL fold metallo-hydrolase [Tepidisphaeraceae bacterium]
MSLELCVLASGSSGNCSVVRAPDGGVVLIDAGIGPRTTAKRLGGTGVTLRDVKAICLTHLDSDHFNVNWIGTIVRLGIRLHCCASRVDAIIRRAELDIADAFARLIFPFDHEPFDVLSGIALRPLRFAHDRDGSHGFVIESSGCRIGYATDLGRVPVTLIEDFTGLDVLAIESNYDPAMQQTSGRPHFLQQRIMGGRGHLSNEQAFEAIRAILDRCERAERRLPSHIVLLHRSRQCNCPSLMRRLFSRDARIAPRLTLTDQFAPSGWLKVQERAPLTGEQLSLAWG